MSRVVAPAAQPPATPRSDFGAKVQAHQRYYARDGKQVPGVTTILGVLSKPALVGWANRLGLQGISTDKYVDEAASIGSLAHAIIEGRLGGKEPNLDDFTPAQLERAQVSVSSFDGWLKTHKLEPHLVEEPLVSDRWRYGGTIDCYGLCDEVPTIVDFKTSSGIYDEHVFQVSGYWRLLQEHGHPVKGARILRIPRNADEGLEERVLTGQQLLKGWWIFEHCLAIYELKRKRQ